MNQRISDQNEKSIRQTARKTSEGPKILTEGRQQNTAISQNILTGHNAKQSANFQLLVALVQQYRFC